MPMDKPNIAMIVAHPDDVAFCFGGTALLLKDKYKLHAINLTRGERGYHWEGKGPQPPDWAVAAAREKDEREACAMINADVSFLDGSDSQLYASPETCEKIAGILSKLKPVAVFTHWPIEKPDHAACWNVVYKAIHMADLFWTTELYMGLMAGDDRNSPRPDVYVNISAVFEEKMKMCACHKRHGDTWIKILTEYNRMLGKQAWCDYAEAYATALPLMSTRWKRKAGSILMELNG